MTEHEHIWGEVEVSRFAGVPHRKCQVEGCKDITLDFDEKDSQEAVWVFFHKVIDWCERTNNDVLSTFDVTDEEWEFLREEANSHPWSSCCQLRYAHTHEDYNG